MVSLIVIKMLQQNSGRALEDSQHDTLMTACTSYALPFFAKLSYDSAVRWRSCQPVEECILGKAVDDLIALLFEKLRNTTAPYWFNMIWDI